MWCTGQIHLSTSTNEITENDSKLYECSVYDGTESQSQPTMRNICEKYAHFVCGVKALKSVCWT